MSRTYRRHKKQSMTGKRHYVHQDFSNPYRSVCIPKWKFHSDMMTRLLSFQYFYCEPMEPANRTKRQQYKREIIKWLKDPDYEIQFKRPRQVWDYY